MAYKAIHIYLDPLTQEFSEFLIALLDLYEYEGIHEREKIIDSYITFENFNLESLKEIQSSLLAMECRMSWDVEVIADQNWNKVWESNFEPVLIDTRCAIRASFHPEFREFTYTITIEPKMAFGTGHHQTTRLMIEQMLQLEFRNMKVLDMGCGTGVLGILASLMGASEVVSIDFDNWAYQSTMENVTKNHIKNLTAIEGNKNSIPSATFDIILANINRNTLLEQMKEYAQHTHQKSLLIVSGILEEDLNSIEAAADKAQFQLLKSNSLDNWIMMMFERK